jgi:hypothetical protein
LFDIYWTDTAKKIYESLKTDTSKKKQYQATKKAVQYLSVNPRHPGLQTHEYHSIKGPKGEKVFEAYIEQNTPNAYRIFWYYGDAHGAITILTITPHA